MKLEIILFIKNTASPVSIFDIANKFGASSLVVLEHLVLSGDVKTVKGCDWTYAI